MLALVNLTLPPVVLNTFPKLLAFNDGFAIVGFKEDFKLAYLDVIPSQTLALNYFKQAEKYLYNEFSVVLNLTYEATKQYIIEHLGGIDDKTLVKGVLDYYGKDLTFSVPILVMFWQPSQLRRANPC